MNLNADFSRRAVVHAGAMAWVPSPMPGVERRMLDRIGDEMARATSIVRYAPGSQFSPHTHGGGEEFMVLEGVFQDEAGDYPAGLYVRNPPESRHTPGSAAGCVIFVKLWQFDPADRGRVSLNTAAAPFVAAEGRPGVEMKRLFDAEGEDVRLERWAPGAAIGLDAIRGGIEILVLSGSFVEGDDHFGPWSWLRLPDGAAMRAETGSDGVVLWVKSGHLGAADRLRDRAFLGQDG